MIQPSSVAVVDESLYEYYVREEVRRKYEQRGDPVPQVFIPKKPRPNGLLNYALAIAFPNPSSPGNILPFIVDMQPHLEPGNAPKHLDVVRNFMHRWNFFWKNRILLEIQRLDHSMFFKKLNFGEVLGLLHLNLQLKSIYGQFLKKGYRQIDGDYHTTTECVLWLQCQFKLKLEMSMNKLVKVLSQMDFFLPKLIH